MPVSDETMEQLQSYMNAKLIERAGRENLSLEEIITRWRALGAINVLDPQTGGITRVFVERFLNGDQPREDLLRDVGLRPEEVTGFRNILTQQERRRYSPPPPSRRPQRPRRPDAGSS